ncbi:hypothetical protein FIM12_01660 [SAR202 cluster bacterium AD-804-J14_MRT_500m]|nr:hypothetical protein [SAR202 cluster bacterium AD-804-J14_MRT_500m]
MNLSGELQSGVDQLWERMVRHPFVIELGNGLLPWEKFKVYFEQDHLFIRAWTHLLCMAISKAPTFEDSRQISGFLDGVLKGEELLFQEFFRNEGMVSEQVDSLEAMPTSLAFNTYLLNLANQGTFHEIISAILCVEWDYNDWAKRLVASGSIPQNHYYKKWIELHAGSELSNFVSYLRHALDVAELPNRTNLRHIFRDCLRYEYLFFEMAYHGEEWPR